MTRLSRAVAVEWVRTRGGGLKMGVGLASACRLSNILAACLTLEGKAVDGVVCFTYVRVHLSVEFNSSGLPNTTDGAGCVDVKQV